MTIDDITVSIICNTYNHEKYIVQALDSFLMQNVNFKYEILIHDDASTDKTADIIREYEKKYPGIIKPIYQTENKYSQRIRITKVYQYPRAMGKYIAFCEGDDFWTDENKLKKQVEFLESNAEYIGCVHKYDVVDCEGKLKDIKTFGYYEIGGDYTFDDFFTNELPSQLATLMIRNIITDSVKGYPAAFNDVFIQSDIMLYIYLLQYGKIYRMDETMSAYRFICESGGTSWSSKSLSRIDGYKKWKEICRFEDVFERVYHRKIYLKNRRIAYAIKAEYDFIKHPSFENFINTLKLMIMQRGYVFALFKSFCGKVTKNIRKAVRLNEE